MALKKPSGGGQHGAERPAVDGLFQTTYPDLFEHLTVTVWPEDGKKRQTSTLLVVAEDGWWKACLHDRAGTRAAWFTGETVKDLLTAIDNALRNDCVAWRADKPWKGGK